MQSSSKNLSIKVLYLVIFIISLQKATAQIFPLGEKGKNVHHVGDVWLNELNAADSVFNSGLTVATMAAGARLDWHKHPGGQILMILEGEGYYQERGKEKLTVRKGEVIKCQPNVEHWHGATPELGVTYLANSPAQKGKTVWLEKLSDEAYFGKKTTNIAINASKEQEIIQISRNKWRLMSEKNVDSLAMLFNEKAMFVHMGGNMNKEQELDVIKTGRIHYKHADIQETSARFVDNTAIVLTKLKLTAVVGGNEVVNPFTVTEFYVMQNGKWSLATLAFSKLLTPP
jgi:4-carboxymuconolactone decarboxylase